MLEVRDLDAFYGDTQVLRSVNFDVAPGEVVTLIGRNGAGKSTTMKSIMGDIPRRSGAIRFKGQDIIGLSPERICKLGIGYAGGSGHVFHPVCDREPDDCATADCAGLTPRPDLLAVSRAAETGTSEGVVAFGRRAADALDRPAALHGIDISVARRTDGRAGAGHH
jgi:ABC-type uncharacterized transport system ATPase subunit